MNQCAAQTLPSTYSEAHDVATLRADFIERSYNSK